MVPTIDLILYTLVKNSFSDPDPHPDLEGSALKWLPWIRIQIRISDADSGSGSSSYKINKNLV